MLPSSLDDRLTSLLAAELEEARDDGNRMITVSSISNVRHFLSRDIGKKNERKKERKKERKTERKKERKKEKRKKEREKKQKRKEKN